MKKCVAEVEGKEKLYESGSLRRFHAEGGDWRGYVGFVVAGLESGKCY